VTTDQPVPGYTEADVTLVVDATGGSRSDTRARAALAALARAGRLLPAGTRTEERYGVRWEWADGAQEWNPNVRTLAEGHRLAAQYTRSGCTGEVRRWFKHTTRDEVIATYRPGEPGPDKEDTDRA